MCYLSVLEVTTYNKVRLKAREPQQINQPLCTQTQTWRSRISAGNSFSHESPTGALENRTYFLYFCFHSIFLNKIQNLQIITV